MSCYLLNWFINYRHTCIKDRKKNLFFLGIQTESDKNKKRFKSCKEQIERKTIKNN